MKYLILIVLFSLLLGCNSKNSKHSKQEPIKLDNELREKTNKIKLVGELFTDNRKGLSFEIKEELCYDLNNDKITDTILIEKIVSWVNQIDSKQYVWDDPGDFHRIRILIGKKEMSLLNTSGWMKNVFLSEYDKNFNLGSLIKSNYITIKSASEDNLLVFLNGYTYASSPGLLTVINIYMQRKPILVFNVNTELFNLKDYNNDGIKDIATTVWDGYYSDKLKNKYRYNVYLLDGGFSYSKEYSKQLSEEMYNQDKLN